MNLPSYLKSLGYVEIPFVLTRVNHIVIQARINGGNVTLIVDTGGSRTAIDESSAARLGLVAGRVRKTADLCLPKKTAAMSKLESLEIGTLCMTNVEAWIVDFSYVNMLVKMKAEQFCDGVLGSDILSRKSAVIDYKCKKLYLKGA